MGSVDVSVIVTTHHEGRFTDRTMRSFDRPVQYAESKGAFIEIIVIMDRPGKAAEDYFTKQAGG